LTLLLLLLPPGFPGAQRGEDNLLYDMKVDCSLSSPKEQHEKKVSSSGGPT
jgi:hypothetical protein